MGRFLENFERVIVIAVMALLALMISLATIDVGWMVIRELITLPHFPLAVGRLLDTFGAFLIVLIGLELLQTVRAYLSDHKVHAEVIYLTAMLAIARKVIIMDVKAVEPTTLLGMASLILALALGYYLFYLSHKNTTSSHSN